MKTEQEVSSASLWTAAVRPSEVPQSSGPRSGYWLPSQRLQRPLMRSAEENADTMSLVLHTSTVEAELELN